MSQAELLAYVAALLDRLEVEWMLVGSHAASYYGEPRSTHDVDIVVHLPAERIDKLLAAVPQERYYLSEVALREGRMANLIDLQTGDKVDMFLVGIRSVVPPELARRRTGKVMGILVPIASPEDTIIAKLRWNKSVGGSERQLRDIIGIVNLRRDALKWPHLNRQIDSEGFRELWDQQIEPEIQRRIDG